MGFFRQFETFNPVSGDVPYQPFSYLPSIAWRARALLKSRTDEQINVLACSIDWAINERFRKVKEDEIQRLEREGDTRFCYFHKDSFGGTFHFNRELEGELNISIAEDTSEVDALKESISQWEDIGGEDSRGTYELFATLSLWLLADSIAWIHYQRSETIKALPADWLGKWSSLSLAGECAINAMDAVCHAEHLQEVERLKEEHIHRLTEIHVNYLRNEAKRQEGEQQRRSMRTEQLNIARHRKTNEAKEKVIKEWEKDPSIFSSAEKAGIHFSDWLEPQGFQYEPRTVKGWILFHAKKIGVRFR